MDREKLIKSLADSMGLVDEYNTRYTEAHYDPSTGTYYCEGISLPHSSMERILSWYRSQMEIYRERSQRDKTSLEMFMRYAVAYNAILMLQNNINK